MSATLQPPVLPHVEPIPESRRLRWIVAQEGSRQTYSVPLAFYRLGKLRIMYSDIWCRWGRGLLKRGPAGARALATRFHPEIPGNLVVSFNFEAIMSRAWNQLRHANTTPEEASKEYCRFGRWYALRVREHLERVDTNPDRDCFFGFNSNCLEVIEALKKRRVFTVVDQVDPARVEEEMILEEMERWPGWAKVRGRITEEYWKRIEAEWKAADAVLVNSEWSKQALVQQGVPAEKIITVPLALDLPRKEAPQPINPVGTLKALWLGSVVIRKGIQYLVEAARLLEGRDIEFLLAGPLAISREAVESFPRNIKVLGRITRDRLAEVYRQAHVFVLPTISDGFAVTQLEAMAHGLPVVTTPNCGRVVTDGVDGLIVPVRDGRALADALGRVEGDRGLLREMSHNALQSVKNYGLPSNAAMINQLVRERRDCMSKAGQAVRRPWESADKL
ncbi:MAG TPA: glycosyltransferase family 4 protein [Candidatus Baltobacteraceae bacterium]|jgi:glycosyltransferase involved in cell wall biosynthesis|nr:glycosyltransferase family 4 protein [Candidatus Baltobacteraceae bacterium]